MMSRKRDVRVPSTRPPANLLILGAFAFISCGDGVILGPPLEPRTADGFWTAQLLDSEFEMSLRENGTGEITGEGALIRPRGSRAFRVSGSNRFPEIAFLLEFDEGGFGTVLVYFQGEFTSSDAIRGRLNGGGFDDDRITFREGLIP